MAENENIQVNITGITPKEQGQDAQYGNWFLIDEDGDFSLDHSVNATIWLVGGGCDGTAGEWNGNDVDVNYDPIVDTGTGTSYSGAGGDGGYVYTATNVKIPKGATLTAVIAQANDKSGTTLNTGKTLLECNQTGYVSKNGGAAGSLPTAPVGEEWSDMADAVLSGSGSNGVFTPYGYIGSSGGGGAVCDGRSSTNNGVQGGEGAGSGTNHRAAGTDATNYGCGGGGGAICGTVAEGQLGGKGKQGCIIIAYTVEIEQKTLVVERHYTKKVTIKKNCDTKYATSQNSTHCCGGNNGCGCGNSSSSFPYSDGVYNANYTDSVNIKNGNIDTEALATKIQNIETENLALTKQVQELQDKLNGT